MFDAEHHRMLEGIKGKLHGYAYALARDRDQAADLTQECILRAIGSRNVPREQRAFRSWLFRILRNLWIDRLRARDRRAESHCDPDQNMARAQASGAPRMMEDVVVNHLAVRQAFVKLSKDHRDVLALVDIGGFSYQEVSVLLDIPQGTVMSRISRARLALAALLSDGQVTSLDVARGRSRDG